MLGSRLPVTSLGLHDCCEDPKVVTLGTPSPEAQNKTPCLISSAFYRTLVADPQFEFPNFDQDPAFSDRQPTAKSFSRQPS